MAESPDTKLTTTSGSFTDRGGTVWSLKSGGASNGLQAARNGKIDTTTKNVVLLQYYQHYAWQTVIDSRFPAPGHWWVWQGKWVDRGPAPAPPPPPVDPTVLLVFQQSASYS